MCFPHMPFDDADKHDICVANTFICIKPPPSSKKRSSSAPPHVTLPRSKAVKPPPERISSSLLMQMERVMTTRGHVSMQWLRVVHSGYGKPLWFQMVEASKRPLVGSRSKAEGCFVALLPGETVEGVAEEMIDINLQVRRLSRFRTMKRANKSRVQFKSEPVWTVITDNGGVVITSSPPFF